MRKGLAATCILLLLAIGSIYWFIPGRLNVIAVRPIHCAAAGAFRHLATNDQWHAWLPSGETGRFRITKTLFNTVEVQIQYGTGFIQSTLLLLPMPQDSSMLQWRFTMISGSNPIRRIQRYRQALAMKEHLDHILSAFQAFIEKKENIYGLSIRETTVTDTSLIAVKITLPAYPGDNDIYKQVQVLKNYSRQHQAPITGYPMVNITPIDAGHYQLMVAIPVSKQLPGGGPVFYKHLVPGKFLFTQVKGGHASIQQAFKQLQLMIEDDHRVVMAIPFQQLVTDRSTEPDTTRWITNIYVPVF